MARCGDCAKFVGLETSEPELLSSDISDGMLSADVKVSRCCADCGGELKAAEFRIEIDVSDVVSQHEGCATNGEEDFLEISEEEYEVTERRHGKTFYRVDASATVTCSLCGQAHDVTGYSDEVTASEFDDV